MGIQHLIISGGGINGLSFLGGLDYLVENEMLDDLKKITGSSVGSVIGLLYLIGIEPIEMGDMYHNYSWNEIMDPDLNIRVRNFSGIIRGYKIINILSDILKSNNINKRITFRELYDKTGKDFYITGVNCYKKRTEYFSHIDTPDMVVLKAIRISIAIPFLFKPVVLNGDVYMDGSTLERLPINKCKSDEENLVMSYKPNHGMGIVSNMTQLMQNQTECNFPCLIFDEINHGDDYLHIVLKCHKETEHFFSKKIQ